MALDNVGDGTAGHTAAGSTRNDDNTLDLTEAERTASARQSVEEERERSTRP